MNSLVVDDEMRKRHQANSERKVHEVAHLENRMVGKGAEYEICNKISHERQ
jgi:hypothetical protein